MSMRRAARLGSGRWLGGALALVVLAGVAPAEEGRKILFLAGADSHGWGTHQHYGGTMVLANGMKESGLPVEVQVIREFPGEKLLAKQDALVIYADGWARHPANGHVEELKKFMDGGGGLTVLHWATGLGSPGMGDKTQDQRNNPLRKQWRDLVGADFEPWLSCSRFWDASFKELAEHPVTRGVPPFTIHDECYFHLRCEDPEHAHVTPMHLALPPLEVIQPGRAMDSGSESAVEAVKRGEKQYCAWGYERPAGGRAFGFTGGHTHWNWARDELRMLILNGIYWCAGGEVPESGIGSRRPSAEEMLEHLEGNPGWTAEALQIALDRAGAGELIRWGQFRGGALPSEKSEEPGKPAHKPGTFFEGEKLKVIRKAGEVRPQDMANFEAGVWSGNAQLWWMDGKPGEVLELELPIAADGTYEVHIGATKAVDYGICSFAVNGEALSAGKVDFFQPSGVSHTGDLRLGRVELKKGPATFAVTIEGAHPEAVKRHMFGLDAVRLVKVGETTDLFDGKSLDGWEGGSEWWRVEDGAITGEIPDGEKLGHNEFLWWDGEVHDFELRLQCRIEGAPSANSGVQFRAQRRDDGHAAGYQADMDQGQTWFGRIYDEHGRGLLVERGTKVEIDAAGQRETSTFRDKEAYLDVVKKDGWNEYVIRAVGARMQTWINGTLACELIDHQLGQHDFSGRVAIQLHSGPGPVVVQVKDIVLTDLGKTEPPQPLGASQRERSGVSPEGKNLGFEDGTLRGWKVEGEVWKGGPVKGDTVTPRRPGQASNHHGDFWVGGYERSHTDAAQGTLTSEPFEVTHPWASFLVGGGQGEATRVEVVAAEGGEVLFTARGEQAENMRPVTVDLREHVGEKIRVRVIDESSGPWGHINYDDFRFHDKKAEHVVPRSSRVATNPVLRHLVANPGRHDNQTVASMSVPEGFQVDLIAQEPELTQPIAFTFDERGRIWVVEAHSYPRRQPEGQGKDRIVILEDADADGSFETRKVFASGLNLVSGIEVGFGGVWVGAAPHLLFIADENGDDVPDGEGEVLLDGWGLQDTHETLNSFIWGPDGWLYGNQGVFCHSMIGKPGTPDDERVEMRAGVWRYHPTRHEFEVFSHGCSNQWGIDFNERGDMFLTHCRSAWGGGPTTYVVQNGHYWNQSNSHHKPFVASGKAGWNPGGEQVFRNFLPSSARYGHGEGGAGKAGSRAIYGGHAHVGTMIYLGGNWPDEYRDQLFTHNLHGRQMNRQVNRRLRSGYETLHAGSDQMHVADDRFMGVELKYGPDGAVYMCDWQDKQHCHNTRYEVWDRSDGGMYRMAWTATWKPVKVDLRKASTEELVAMQFENDEWFVRTARRVLQERGDKGAVPLLRKALTEATETPAILRGMWALHAVGGEIPETALQHPDDSVRAWAVRLMTERGSLAASRFHELGERDPSAAVRLALASALPSLDDEARWKAAELLAGRSEDRGDTYVPKLIWFGIAPLALDDPERIVAIAKETELDVLAESIMWYVSRDAEGREALVDYLQEAPANRLARGVSLMASTFSSAAKVEPPNGWAELAGRRNKATAAAFDRLGAVFGDREIAARMEKVLADRAAPLEKRQEAFRFLAGRNDHDASKTFVMLLGDDAFRSEVIPLLGRYNKPFVAQALLKVLPELEGEDRRNALSALSSQPVLAKTHLVAIKAQPDGKSGLTSAHLRQMRNLGDEEVNALIDEIWGRVAESSSDMKASIEKYRKLMAAHADEPVDREAGHAVFAKVCAACHTLHGEGAKLGPDLTGSWRNGLDYFLENIVDPNAVIGENFQLNIVTKTDGGVVSGMPAGETPETLTIQTLTEAVEIPKDQIKSRQVLEQSMMAPGLLDTLPEGEVVDLLKYLTSE